MKIKILCTIFLLAGCAASTSDKFDNHGLTLADENGVKNCKFLQDVSGFSAFYGLTAKIGYTNARNDALLQAKNAGATHVVINKQNSNLGNTQVDGRAYRCKANS